MNSYRAHIEMSNGLTEWRFVRATSTHEAAAYLMRTEHDVAHVIEVKEVPR
jgi:hypothetical protein